MVEYSPQLDTIFHSLSDPIRRDMLRTLTQREAPISDLASRYDVSFAAVSKHLKVLEKAELVRKRKEGRQYIVSLELDALQEAERHLERYRQMWQSRFHKLNKLLKEE